MRKLEIAADSMRIAIRRIQRSDESRYDHRLHGSADGERWVVEQRGFDRRWQRPGRATRRVREESAARVRCISTAKHVPLGVQALVPADGVPVPQAGPQIASPQQVEANSAVWRAERRSSSRDASPSSMRRRVGFATGCYAAALHSELDRRPPAGIAARRALTRRENASRQLLVQRYAAGLRPASPPEGRRERVTPTARAAPARRDLPPQSGAASHQTFQIVELVRGLVSAAAGCGLDRKQQSQGAVLSA